MLPAQYADGVLRHALAAWASQLQDAVRPVGQELLDAEQRWVHARHYTGTKRER